MRLFSISFSLFFSISKLSFTFFSPFFDTFTLSPTRIVRYSTVI